MTKALPAIPGFEQIEASAGVGHNNPPSPIDLEALKAMSAETLYLHNEYENVLKELEAEADKFVPDISTKAGREAITSMAFALTRCRTILSDDKGKEAKAEADKQVKDVNAKKNAIADRLNKKIAAIRKPLDEIEAKERAEKARIDNANACLRELSVFHTEPSLDEIDRRIKLVDEFKDFDWGDYTQEAGEGAYSRAKLFLMDKRTTRAQQIADAQELERLRVAELERKAQAEPVVVVTTTPTIADGPNSADAQAMAAHPTVGIDLAQHNQLVEDLGGPVEWKAEPVSADARANFEKQKELEKERQRHINGAAVRGLMDACPFLMQEQAKNVVRAIIGKQVPHVIINYGEYNDL